MGYFQQTMNAGIKDFIDNCTHFILSKNVKTSNQKLKSL